MKKILALVLTLALCLSAGAMVAYAAGNDTTASNVPTDMSNIPVPEIIENDAVAVASASGACDIEGIVESAGDGVAPCNVNKSETITLAKGESKTYTFDVDGGWFNPDHNTVSVVIDNVSGGSYRYISEDVTNDTELANLTYSGNANRTLTNLVPESTYEITIINLESDSITLTVSLTSYID